MDDRIRRGWRAVQLHPDLGLALGVEPRENIRMAACDIVADIMHAVSRGSDPAVKPEDLDDFLQRALRTYDGDMQDALVEQPVSRRYTVVFDIAGDDDPAGYITGLIEVGDREERITNVDIHPEDLTS